MFNSWESCLCLSWWMVEVFRSDCKVFGCISSKSEQNWCFVLVCGDLAFELVLRCYILLYIYYYILLYITIIIHILYYTLLFLLSPSLLSPHLPLLPNILFLFRSFLTFPTLFSSILLFLSLSSQYSPIFILYLSVLTYTYLYYLPNTPSQISDPARSIGVDG